MTVRSKLRVCVWEEKKGKKKTQAGFSLVNVVVGGSRREVELKAVTRDEEQQRKSRRAGRGLEIESFECLLRLCY